MNDYYKKIFDKYNNLNSQKKIDGGILREYILEDIRINQLCHTLSKQLNSFEKDELGLTLDSIRQTEDYKKIDSSFKFAFKELQEFNKNNKELSKYYKKHFPYIPCEEIDFDYIHDLNIELIKTKSIVSTHSNNTKPELRI